MNIVKTLPASCNSLVNGAGSAAAHRARGSVLVFMLALAAATSISATASADVFCTQVSDTKDDAEEEVSDGNMHIGSGDLDLNPSQVVGMRFRNLPLPQGATISYAYLGLVADDSDSGYSWLRLFGEDHNDAKNFDNDDHEITDRPLTDAYVDWVPQPWSTGNEYFSPPLTTIVQEIVDRPSWSSGNDLALIIESYAGNREAESFDGSSSDAPQLCVYY